MDPRQLAQPIDEALDELSHLMRRYYGFDRQAQIAKQALVALAAAAERETTLRNALQQLIEYAAWLDEIVYHETSTGGEYIESDEITNARDALAVGVAAEETRQLKATGDEPIEVVNSGAEDWVEDDDELAPEVKNYRARIDAFVEGVPEPGDKT